MNLGDFGQKNPFLTFLRERVLGFKMANFSADWRKITSPRVILVVVEKRTLSHVKNALISGVSRA